MREHDTLKSKLLEALGDCAPMELYEDEASPRLDPCADENEFASRVAEVGVVLCLQRRMRERRARIEAALRRIDAADYGVCEDCGEDIGLARLLANPTATLCVHCQADRESAPQLRCA